MGCFGRSRVCVLGLALLILVPSCRKDSRPLPLPPQADTVGLTGGESIFEEDFSAGLDRWQTSSRNWSLVQGALSTGDKMNRNEGIWLKNVALPRNVRIEFDAKSVKGNNTAFQGDIKCEFGGDEPEHASGYIVIFGGWVNTKNLIARKDEHNDGPMVVEADTRVEENRTYRFAVVRLGTEIRWYLDGKLFLKANDPEMLTGGVFGFNNWNSRVTFDNVKIFQL